MKTLLLSICLVGLALPGHAQSPESMQYAARAILLLSGQAGVEGVMPMVFTANGQNHLEYVSGPKSKGRWKREVSPFA